MSLSRPLLPVRIRVASITIRPLPASGSSESQVASPVNSLASPSKRWRPAEASNPMVESSVTW